MRKSKSAGADTQINRQPDADNGSAAPPRKDISRPIPSAVSVAKTQSSIIPYPQLNLGSRKKVILFLCRGSYDIAFLLDRRYGY